MAKIMILGSTGLVGGEVLKLCLSSPEVDQVVTPVRVSNHAPPLKQSKHLWLQVDFDHLPDEADWWKVDAVIFALGTTIKKARTQDTFRKVDYDYPLRVAKIARAHGVKTFVLNSAIGADKNSLFFYSRVKGEIEVALQNLGFESLTLCRPGLLLGERKEFRAAEEFAKMVSALLNPLLPKSMKPNPAEKVAVSMLSAALKAVPGVHVISSEAMV